MEETNLFKYRIEQLEETVCKHENRIEANANKIHEHDRLIDRVGLKLDQIAENVIEVKTGLNKLTEKRETELETEVERPKKLKWEVIGAVALMIITAVITSLFT